jgi:uncharacterized membrane protein YoaT (DUF817 family)
MANVRHLQTFSWILTYKLFNFYLVVLVMEITSLLSRVASNKNKLKLCFEDISVSIHGYFMGNIGTMKGTVGYYKVKVKFF